MAFSAFLRAISCIAVAQLQSGCESRAHSLRWASGRRSLAVAGRISIQIALDIVAAVGAYNLSAVLGAQEGLPLKWLWSGLTAFLGSYFGAGTALHLFIR